MGRLQPKVEYFSNRRKSKSGNGLLGSGKRLGWTLPQGRPRKFHFFPGRKLISLCDKWSISRPLSRNASRHVADDRKCKDCMRRKVER